VAELKTKQRGQQSGKTETKTERSWHELLELKPDPASPANVDQTVRSMKVSSCDGKMTAGGLAAVKPEMDCRTKNWGSLQALREYMHRLE
jgi:hypothetical protein